MKILKNLLGENAKIHGDSIFLESGSNDDGYWVRFPDGMQACVIPEKNLVKSSDYYLAGGGSFPQRFKEADVVVIPIFVKDSKAPIGRFTSTNINELGFNLWYQNISAPFTAASYDLKYRAIAIGRWN